MTKRSFAIVIAICALIVLFSPFFLPPVHAQQFVGDTGPSGIVPCGDPGDPECQACYLAELAGDALNFAVYFSVFVATLLFTYAGFLYITAGGDSTKISKATGVFGKVIIGLVIVLIAWLVINLIMTTFFYGSPLGGNTSWYSPFSCTDLNAFRQQQQQQAQQQSSTQNNNAGVGVTTSDSLEVTQPSVDGDEYTETGGRSAIAAEGVNINKTPCPPGVSFQQVEGGCTSTAGIKKTTVGGLGALKRSCEQAGGQACPTTLTAGTELGHTEGSNRLYTHNTGFKVDVSKRSSRLLDGYISQLVKENGTQFFLKDPKTGETYQYRILDEPDHWDVQIFLVP